MAIVDRFKEITESGVIVDADEMEAPLSPQMKYDFLAAINAINQLEAINAEFTNRKKYREELKATLLKSCAQSVKKITDDEENFTLKKIDTAIKMLTDCRREIAKIDSVDRECERLAKITRHGANA